MCNKKTRPAQGRAIARGTTLIHRPHTDGNLCPNL